MPYDNVALTRRWFEEVWNQGRPEAIDELLAPDGVAHGLGGDGGDLHGPEAFKTFQAMYRGAFPDIRFTVEDVVSQGDIVAVRFSGHGTHLGDHLGVAPTQKRVDFTGMTFAQWKDGRIRHGWNNVDMLGIMSQIGAIQPSSG